MIYVWHHAVSLVVAIAAVPLLTRTSWTHRAPRVAIVLWQITMLTAVTSLIGLLLGLGLAPYQRGIGPALALLATDLTSDIGPGLSVGGLAAVSAGLALAGWILLTALRDMRIRARQRVRHRQLLHLVAEPEPHSSALVLDHPLAAAYYLPGREPSVVISTGALNALTDEQRAAVLAHEDAHAREHHHLVLAPFHTLRSVFPRSRTVRSAAAHVALLLEMCADDHAARCHGVDAVVTALRRFDTLGRVCPPPGTLAMADTEIAARLARLTNPGPPPHRVTRALALTIAITAAATPLSLFALPM